MPITAIATTEADVSAIVPIRRRIWGSHGGGTEQLKTATAKITYQVDWTDLWSFIRLVNGIFPTGPQRLPMQCPDLPGILVDSTSYKGKGRGTDCDHPYKYAEVDVTFKTPSYETSGDDAWLKIDRNLGGDFVTCPSGVYSFADGVRNNETGVGEFVPLVCFSITRVKIQNFDDSSYLPYVGKISNAVMYGTAIGTLRFDGLQSTSSTDIGGVTLTDATWAFTWRRYSWNWAKHPVSGAWGVVTPPLYESATLGDILT